MTNIRITQGTYKIRGKEADMAGLVFPLVEEFKVGAAGGYVTVDGAAVNGVPRSQHQDQGCGPGGLRAGW